MCVFSIEASYTQFKRKITLVRGRVNPRQDKQPLHTSSVWTQVFPLPPESYEDMIITQNFAEGLVFVIIALQTV